MAPSGRSPANDGTGIDYELIAAARRAAPDYVGAPVRIDELTAAYRYLNRYGWLSQIIDPETQMTMRPTEWTRAELALVCAELDARKGFEPEGAAAAEIAYDGRRIASGSLVDTGTAPVDMNSPRAAHPGMNEAEEAAWRATRADDERHALAVLATERGRAETGARVAHGPATTAEAAF